MPSVCYHRCAAADRGMNALKTVFMGTPEFAVPVLSALLDAGHDVAAVYTRPDRPVGWGRKAVAPPVKVYAEERGLPVVQPASLREGQAQAELAALSPDAIVVAAYGLFLPTATLGLPPSGCLNVHPSLLPKYRGPSPVAAAILSGDAATGVTIIRLDEGMDTGPIVAQRQTTIGPEENADELTSRLFQLGAELLVGVFPEWAEGRIDAVPQDESRATTTKLLTREDGDIDWQAGADSIARQVRAYRPWPGAYTRWSGRLLKIVRASPAEPASAAGEGAGRVVPLQSGGLGIVAGDGVLEVKRLQLEGRTVVDSAEFLRGHPDFVGSVVGR